MPPPETSYHNHHSRHHHTAVTMSFIHIIINLFTQLISSVTTSFLQLHPTPNSESIELQETITITSDPFHHTGSWHTLTAQTSIQAAHYHLQLPSHSSSYMCFWVIHTDPGVIIHFWHTNPPTRLEFWHVIPWSSASAPTLLKWMEYHQTNRPAS